MVMGLLGDIRSGKRSQLGLGVYAIIFWFCAGLSAGGGTGAYAGDGSHKAVLMFGGLGVAMGLCIRFYAAFGNTKFAKALAFPGLLLATLEFLV
jgi:hypothetical protein